MSSLEKGKLNRMLQAVPRDTVVTSPRLHELGISPQLARKYVQSGWLIRLGSGAFARAGETPTWTGGLYALQSQLGLTIHVGARTALELQGHAHFVPLGEKKRVVLVSDTSEHLPSWFTEYPWLAMLRHRCLSLFEDLPNKATVALDCGGYSVSMSSPERAIIEDMHLARTNSDFEHAELLMDGLTMLRPDVVQSLLSACKSVKAKRLFLWSAETAQHAWFNRLDLGAIALGKGKRQLFKGGVLDPKYLITVPPREEFPSV